MLEKVGHSDKRIHPQRQLLTISLVAVLFNSALQETALVERRQVMRKPTRAFFSNSFTDSKEYIKYKYEIVDRNSK